MTIEDVCFLIYKDDCPYEVLMRVKISEKYTDVDGLERL